MADVRVLVIGADRNNWRKGEKGDVWEVVQSGVDWGNKTTAPEWVRLTITGVPGTQEEAEERIRGYLTDWRRGFILSEVAGATGNLQRYRVEVVEELGEALPANIEIAIRNHILGRFNGNLVAQQASVFFEFDSYPGLPLDEVSYEISQVTGGLRRYRFADAVVDNALNGVTPGQPAEESATFVWVSSNIIDKLRG
jgi:hypothetical protein